MEAAAIRYKSHEVAGYHHRHRHLPPPPPPTPSSIHHTVKPENNVDKVVFVERWSLLLSTLYLTMSEFLATGLCSEVGL